MAPRLIPYDFVGTVENLNHDLSLVLGQIFGEWTPVSDYTPHRTDATAKIQAYYSPAEIKLVQRIYAEDFASLGYDLDPARLERVKQSAPSDASALKAGADRAGWSRRSVRRSNWDTAATAA